MDIDKLEEEFIKTAKSLGASEERNRILTELEKINLPAGIWTLIKPVFNPEE